MICYLYNKREKVAELNGEIKTIKDGSPYPMFVCNSIQIINPELRPFILCTQDYDSKVNEINNWFQKRAISKKRQGLPEYDEITVSGKPHFFTLTDQYWVCYDEKSETWDDLNFFTNDFDESLGDYFFKKTCRLNYEGEILTNKNIDSPDITTGGVANKKWIIENGKRYLIKESVLKRETDIISEILASKLLQQMHFPDWLEITNYDVSLQNFRICSKCECFCDENTELVSAFDLCYAIPMNQPDDIPKVEQYYNHLKQVIDYCEIDNGLEFLKYLIGIDRRFGNPDRHLCNILFKRNVTTGELLCPAAIYDFGQAFTSEGEVHALFQQATEEDINIIEKIKIQDAKNILTKLLCSKNKVDSYLQKINILNNLD
jgi:hypothetical protein